MENLIKKVSYLKGLADGLDISEKTDEGKLLIKMVEVLGEVADAVEKLDRDQRELADVVDALDEDLADVEETVFDDDDAGCDCCGHDDDSSDVDYFEIQCPNCKETVYIDEDFFDDDAPIVCPNCNQEIELDFSCDCDCDESDDKDSDQSDE